MYSWDFFGEIVSLSFWITTCFGPAICVPSQTVTLHFFSYVKQEQGKTFEFYSCYENLHLETVSENNISWTIYQLEVNLIQTSR